MHVKAVKKSIATARSYSRLGKSLIALRHSSATVTKWLAEFFTPSQPQEAVFWDSGARLAILFRSALRGFRMQRAPLARWIVVRVGYFLRRLQGFGHMAEVHSDARPGG